MTSVVGWTIAQVFDSVKHAIPALSIPMRQLRHRWSAVDSGCEGDHMAQIVGLRADWQTLRRLGERAQKGPEPPLDTFSRLRNPLIILPS